jgi:hypothetical protein
MSIYNNIEVTITGGFLTIKNVSNPNASIETYNLGATTSLNEYYQDYTALNAYQPGSGRYEFNKEYSVLLDIEENPTDLVKIQFDIQNVTNQPGWTADRAGLAQAIADIQAGVTAGIGGGGGGATVPTTPVSGSKLVAVAATSEPLVAVATPMVKVDITALGSNTDIVVVGDSSVVALLASRTGTPLGAGDTVTIVLDDLNKIYIDSVVSGEGVSFNYYN